MAADLEALLNVQELDLAVDQLRHRRAGLPERATLVAGEADLERIVAARAEVRARYDELARQQKRLEDEIALVRDKAGQVDRTLYGGTVRNPKELMDLQEELNALGRRQRSLEDQELDVMEQLEPVEAELVSLEAERASTEGDLSRLRDAVAGGEAVIDEELAEVAERRLKAVAPIPPAVLDEYERLRDQLGGIGVARLVGSTCAGCHLTLPAVEVDRIRHGEAGPFVHCYECGRLLVP
ncbi:MAG: zinc ribbon domain-containing protein [Acidimicrobiales bacterium]